MWFHIAKRRPRPLHNDRCVAGCDAEPVPDGASPWRKSVELLSHLVSGQTMDSVLFLLEVIGIIVVVAWSVMNDRVPSNGRTRGLLAMREEAPIELATSESKASPKERHIQEP
jgi:hypothetical protein